MRLYITEFKLRLIIFFQYRASAIAGLSTQFFWALMMILIYMNLFEHGASVGITLEQTITYTWLHQALFAFINIRISDNEITGAIKDGNVAYEIVRPYNLYFWWYIKVLSKRVASGLLRFLPVIIIAFLLPKPYGLSIPYSFTSFLLFMITLIFGILLVAALNLLVYTIAFYTYNSNGISSILNVFMELLSGGLVPVVMLPLFIQKSTYYLPFRLISDLPFRVYSGNIYSLNALTGIILQIIWLIILLFVGNLIVKKSLKKVFNQGG